jgi:hypothetical protein
MRHVLDVLIGAPWLLALLWAGLYIFDYASTVWLSRVYRTTLSKYVVFERGVELNPNFEREIARAKGFSLKFVILLLLVAVLVLLSPVIGYAFVEFLAGALLLTWSFVNARHLRNYFYVWLVGRRPEALGGQQLQSYWFMQRQLAGEALVWALLYLFLFVLIGRIFFLAGVLTCMAVGLRAWLLANRKFKAA